MVPQKRIFIAAASALAVTLALAGCGSNDYGLSSADPAVIGAAPAAAGAVKEAEPAEELAENDGDTTEAEDAEDADKEEAAAGEQEAVDEAEAAEKGTESSGQEAESSDQDAKPAGKVSNKLISKAVPKMGNVVTDAKGWVLYRFDKDDASPSKSNCVGDCAKLWPPLLAGDTLELTGLSAAKVDTIERADGGLQVTIDGVPVYRYIGDQKAGDWKGQNVNGTWFVVDKNGKKNLTCLPKVSKAVALPASAKTVEAETVKDGSDY